MCQIDDDDRDNYDDKHRLQSSTLSHSEKEEKAPRVASYDCSRETRAGGEELAFPVVSPIPSFLASRSLSPLPSYSICVSLSLLPLAARFARDSFLRLSLSRRYPLSLGVISPVLSHSLSLSPLARGRRRNSPLDVSEPLALFYQPSGVDWPECDWPETIPGARCPITGLR